jgi:DNA (cytosine-5)-methyltransferase 1
MIPILTNTYFSGAGLMDIGLQAGGLTLQQSFEIDALCCDTLRQNFAHEVVQCDITQKRCSLKKNAT